MFIPAYHQWMQQKIAFPFQVRGEYILRCQPDITIHSPVLTDDDNNFRSSAFGKKITGCWCYTLKNSFDRLYPSDSVKFNVATTPYMTDILPK